MPPNLIGRVTDDKSLPIFMYRPIFVWIAGESTLHYPMNQQNIFEDTKLNLKFGADVIIYENGHERPATLLVNIPSGLYSGADLLRLCKR